MTKFSHDGLTVWYEGAAPAAEVRGDQEITLKIGVQPPHLSNVVLVRYRVNKGKIEVLRAIKLGTDYLKKADYFQARFPQFFPGDLVEFVVVCQCAGRQAPDPATSDSLMSSFRVMGPRKDLLGGAAPSTTAHELPGPKGTSKKASDRNLADRSHEPQLPALGRGPGIVGEGYDRVRPERLSRDQAEQALREALRAKQELEREIRELRTKIRAIEQRLESLRRSGRRDADIEELLDILKELNAALESKLKELKRLEQIIGQLRRRLDELKPAVDEPIPGLSDRYPILLFPVHLETRFMGDAASPELWVRIYPDQLCIESHQPELTRPEVEGGRLYADRNHIAHSLTREEGEDIEAFENRKKSAKVQAWRALAGRFGPRRAAWIARETDGYRDSDLEALAPESTPETPKVYVMPDYFVVRCYQDGECIAESPPGNRVKDPLPMLFNLTETRTGGEVFDTASRWIVDFPAALEAGMALKIDLSGLTPEQLRKGFDRVIAVGVKTSRDGASKPEEHGARLLEAFIDSHHYTDGIAFLPYETPTNNTGTTASGHSQYARDYEESYRVELNGENLTAGGNDANKPEGCCDARKLAWALGIDNVTSSVDGDRGNKSIFSHISNAGNVEASPEFMLSALWPATWGFYCRALGLIKSNCLEVVREHYARFVRPRGPLPTLRLGNLPYGVLPVSKVRGWKAAPAMDKGRVTVETCIYNVLLKLFDLFLSMANDPRAVPRVGETDDPDAELLNILAMEPSAVTYGERIAALDVFIKQLLWFTSSIFFGPNSVFATPTNPLAAYDLANQWIATWQEQLTSNANLLHEITGLEVNAGVSAPSPGLLRLIHWNSVNEGNSDWANENFTFSTPDGELQLKVGGLLRRFIEASYNLDPTSVGAALRELIRRPNIPIEVNEQHFRDALSLSTHRLDAWITSFAKRRLDAMRKEQPLGILIGAYGWGENLRPGNTYDRTLTWLQDELTAVPLRSVGASIPAGPRAGTAMPGSMRVISETLESQATPSGPIPGGYIHAPSIPQATAAAVLRSSHITRSAEGIPEATKVNLTSDRVRLALQLINGVREGQQVGALLGYQFERGLHECFRDQYIDEFRNAFPLKAGKETELQDGESAETVAARNVVDGLRLATVWRDAEPRVPKTLSSSLPEADVALIAELDRLVEALDAVSDLWFTEAIFQGTQGRYEAMGAALDAAAGVGLVPQVECVRTPRSRLSHSHRVCVVFSSVRDYVVGLRRTPVVDSRSTAELALNSWAARVLGNTGGITCHAQVAGEYGSRIVTLQDLAISPIDFVYLSATPPSGEDTELEQLIRYTVRKGNDSHAALDAAIEVKLDLDPPGEERTFAQAVAVAHSLLQIIANSTPLRPAMLCLPEDEGVKWNHNGDETEEPEEPSPPLGVFTKEDCTDLLNRVNAGLATLIGPAPEGSVSILDDLLNPGADDSDKCAALDRARRFGIPGAVPASTAGDALLNSRIDNVVAEIEKRAKKAQELLAVEQSQTGAGQFDNWIKTLISAMKALFGASFTVLPTFPAPQAAELQQALYADILGGSRSDRIWLWLQQAAHTHPSLHKLETALMMGEAWQDAPVTTDMRCDQDAAATVSAQPRFDLQIAQLPFKPDDRWIALDFLAEDNQAMEDRPQGCLSLALHVPVKPDPATTQTHSGLDVTSANRLVSGILIDQWEEPIPNKQEVTAVSFNYDQPSQQAPQALLLAVPGEWHEEPGEWRLEDVFEIVADTMDLMKVRTVDLDALRQVGQFLPALYLRKEIPRIGPTPITDMTPVGFPVRG